uniref:Protein kinase domain-containing protein n=1 Tax=Ditylenchus dipsaci TaxID=166011 RepID=A0A915ETD6_9BILA
MLYITDALYDGQKASPSSVDLLCTRPRLSSSSSYYEDEDEVRAYPKTRYEDEDEVRGSKNYKYEDEEEDEGKGRGRKTKDKDDSSYLAFFIKFVKPNRLNTKLASASRRIELEPADFNRKVKQIGEGTSGQIFEVKAKNTYLKDQKFVMKETNISNLTGVAYDSALNEVAVASHLKDHYNPDSHIIKIICLDQLGNPHVENEYNSKYRMVMEYIDGLNMEEFYFPAYECDQEIKNRYIEEQGYQALLNLSKEILRNVAIALHYLHCIGVVHGDVKPENVMIEFKNGTPSYEAKVVVFD